MANIMQHLKPYIKPGQEGKVEQIVSHFLKIVVKEVTLNGMNVPKKEKQLTSNFKCGYITPVVEFDTLEEDPVIKIDRCKYICKDTTDYNNHMEKKHKKI